MLLPAHVYAGAPATIGLDGGDALAATTVSWSTSDGASGSGASFAHTFAAPGAQSVTFSATDALGFSAAPATFAVNVESPPAGGGGATGGLGSSGGGSLDALALGGAKVGADGTITITGTNGSGGLDRAIATVAQNGRLAAATAKAKKQRRKTSKTITYGSASTSTRAAGAFTLAIRPTAAAKRLLRRGRPVTVLVSVTFTPTAGGKPITKTTTTVVKLANRKKKR